jgi:6-phosphogluconolactonase/glucosamine-6-phosphate isomerase/deaminase
VRRALAGPVETACPASVLREHAHVTLHLDADSASAWRATNSEPAVES